ncbi:hypothetical protein KI387_001636, partial [Taxus chinensis]
DYDKLALSTNPSAGKNLQFLIECMDDLLGEQQRGVYDRLVLSTNPFVEKNLESLIECMDALSGEQQSVCAWDDNMAHKVVGEELLPEDVMNPIFKPTIEPSRLDNYLIINQVANYCDQIKGENSEGILNQKAAREEIITKDAYELAVENLASLSRGESEIKVLKAVKLVEVDSSALEEICEIMGNRALICKFIGLWPSKGELWNWIEKNWECSERPYVRFLTKGFFQ